MSKKQFLILLIALLTIFAAFAALAIPSIAANEDYKAPAYLVDFNDPANIAKAYDIFYCALTHSSEQQAMQVLFIDNQNGTCFDPYFSFPLPAETVDVGKYHYLALLIKTDFTGRSGQMRLRSATTADQYPFFNFNYQDTSDWQVVIVDLADVKSAGAFPQSWEISGKLSNLRLDMFDNFCDPGVNYYIKAYGLYDNYEDAQTFIHFESEVTNEPVKPDIDYSAFWRGEAFYAPANAHRMNWVAYGFNSTYKAQVDALLHQGYGGIVSNVNFNQQYLKDESEFALLRDTYLYGKQNDMTLWIYDEYQWPSGSAYGQVLDTNGEWRATGIEHIQLVLDSAKGSYSLRNGIDISLKLATVKAGGKTWTLDTDGASLKFDLTSEIDGECLLDLYVLRYTDDHVEDRTDFSTLYHVDTLRPDSVARFIELTHKHYKDSFGEDFSMIEAFFTDEPSQGNRDMENYIVWTEGLDVKFKEKYGYELQLPLLFEGRDETAQRMRIHYYSLVADLFKTSYIDQITAWCEQNGVASSGHLLFEENMNDHVETYGGDFMQIIGGMTIPGVDVLWIHPNQLLSQCNIGNHLGVRFVASAARNAGKTDVMVEYNPSAAPTDDFNHDKLGASIGGATLTRLFGTTVYNVINPQKDYTYEQINQINTYVGRLNTILDGTVEAGDLAIFYPIATVQALHNADDVHSSAHGGSTDAVKLNENYTALCLDLLQRQVLYTVIDDQSICAATVTADGRLVIGNGSYRTLVLAFGEYISAEAAEKLALFKQAGGTVVFVSTGYEDYKATEADKNDRVIAAMEKLADCDQFKANVAGNRISKLANHTMKLSDLEGLYSKTVLYGEFFDAERDISYVANTTDTSGKATLEFTDGYSGAYTVYYPYSGIIESGSGNSVTIDLPAYCAVLIMREDKNQVDNTPFVPTEQDDTSTDSSAETQAPDSEGDSQQTTEEQTSEGGCKSAIGALPLVAAAAACAIVVSKKKRK
ncbi:MAG: hypothetical protein IJW70_11070 [Clostridia bacterium]|nr:hypothetical protein [Clostridia bacterium]